MILDYLAEALAAVVALLITALFGLFRRVRGLEESRASRDEKITAIDQKLDELIAKSKRIDSLRTDMEIERVRREDWVPTMSKIVGSLERQNETLARMDERLIHIEGRRND